MTTAEAEMEMRGMAIMVAINFAGRMLSESDGTYGLLIDVVQDAMRDWAKAAVEEEREACAEIAMEWVRANTTPLGIAAVDEWGRVALKIARKIRARSDAKLD